ncbi:MAG: hypothetical protein KBG47_12815 [Bacteroidia bacterium]|nr:hypothetical protein [Bacteroidia bacterium]
MRKHNGMRPQDIAILLKIISINDPDWHLVKLSNALHISISEISESLNRSRLAHLIDHKKKNVSRQSLMEFLEHGIRYVFPQEPGAVVRGIPTAHSHPTIRNNFVSEMVYVWPSSKGKIMGQMIEPLYAKQVAAVDEDDMYYKLLSLVDLVRVGKVREINYAIKTLRKNILNEPSR